MRKKIKRGQKVEVSFSPRERELVLDHTLTGPELTTALRRSRVVDGKHVVRYTLGDLDELLGFVAAEANHSADKKIRKELDTLYARVRHQMESYASADALRAALSRRRCKEIASRGLRRTRTPLRYTSGRDRRRVCCFLA